ncbi:phenolic acid decarboxylase [bacterium]|nr:phenolic acid decarboxylase [bacterium]
MKSILGILLLVSSMGQASEGLTAELNGKQLTYRYDNGGHYQIRYAEDGVRYRFLSGKAGDKWWGPFPYKAFKTTNGEYFLGWYEKGFGDQITQLVNLQNKTLYGSGIIVKKSGVVEHFERAQIEKIE